ncbi:MAG: hypothetical protein RLZZ555_84 [Pseudomonadota bacterium]|jgi:uncharacterized protein
MKYLLLLLVILAGAWLWRSRRAQDHPPPPPAQPAAPPQPGLMVSCRHCGLHLPASDAISDAQGHYCSVEHLRLQREKPAKLQGADD